MDKENSSMDFELEFKLSDFMYKDLMGDFLFVKDMNRVMSIRYSELLGCFPTVKEFDLLLSRFKELQEMTGHDLNTSLNYDNEKFNERLLLLKKFNSALIALEKNDPNIKPKPYEDIESGN